MFDLCYFSNGAFTHDDVYNMPSSYRRYYIKLLSKELQRQSEELKEQQNKIKIPSKK